MKHSLRFPIRIKILLGLLVTVTIVVGLITAVMANLFHEDKETYIRDLTSMAAMGAAEECRSLLESYHERLKASTRIMGREDLDRGAKSRLLKDLFQDYEDFVAIVLYESDREVGSVFNVALLESAGLTQEDIRKHRQEDPLPMDRIVEGEVHVRNSSLAEDLPTFTMAQALRIEGRAAPIVVAAEIRLDDLLDLAGRSSIFDISIVDASGLLLAHADPGRVTGRALSPRVDLMARAMDERSASVTLEYDVEGTQTLGGFAGTGFAGVTAVAEIPRSAAFLASRQFLKSLFLAAILLLLFATFISLLGSRRLTRPIETLSGLTSRIAEGNFDTRINVRSNDEIGSLAESFNRMTLGLRERDEALRQANAALIQSEKLAAFGQLGAGIAHEVKNPLAGILGCAQLSLRKVEPETPIHGNLLLIEKETKRCKTIIENLLKFARQEKAVMKATDVNQVVQDAVAIVSHQMEISQVKLEARLAEGLPEVHGNANQLQQVLMNLLMNAQQAMEGRSGNITIATRHEGGKVILNVADNGPGMTPEIRARIFEPFFTTKPGGKGTGLGLSVSFGIIRDHEGEIRVDSTPGAGTTFTIELSRLAAQGAENQAAVQAAQ